MIYLDYAANTPVNAEVLEVFCEISKEYIANPNSGHLLGKVAKERLMLATEAIANQLGVKSSEVIYTSGASEANNLAIKGIANQYRRQGKHIITSYLEHSSITNTCAALQNAGYEIDFVDVLPNGLIDFCQLKALLREDTVLVSIGYVDSELGICQNINEIGRLLKDYPNCFFHVDATQAVGKIPISLENIDLMSFAPHKFYGLNGSGVLIKKENIVLEPLIHGGGSTTVFRSGTPMLALAVATEKALTLALSKQDEHYAYVKRLNEMLREGLSLYPDVKINSTHESSPFILNLSFKGINSGHFQQALEKYEVYVSTKAACTTVGTPSRPVYAITKDRKLALSPLRISLSHLVTKEDIRSFLDSFKQCYEKLSK